VVGKITLTWVDPDDEDVDHVAISCTDPVGGFASKTVKKNVQTLDITGLVDGQAYGIQVQTVDKSGNKSAGAFKVVVIGKDTPPAEVTDLIAIPGDKRVRLSWIDPADPDFDHVEISYSADSGHIQTLSPVTKGVQWKLIESLNYGTLYGFTVRTVDSSGNKSSGTLAMASLATVVTDLDLAQYITAPLAGVVPDTRAIVGP
jgi:predicted phage tail protein